MLAHLVQYVLVIVLEADHVDQAVHAGLLVGHPGGAEVGGVRGREQGPLLGARHLTHQVTPITALFLKYIFCHNLFDNTQRHNFSLSCSAENQQR